MRTTLGLICLVLLAAICVTAQEVPKVETFGGYSYAGGNFHGWNASMTGNANDWFGITADFSGHYGHEVAGSIRINQNAHSFLFGPRLPSREETYAIRVCAVWRHTL